MARFMTEGDKQRIRDLRAQGKTHDQISAIVKRHPITVGKFLKRDRKANINLAKVTIPAITQVSIPERVTIDKLDKLIAYEIAAVDAGKKSREVAFDAIAGLFGRSA